MTASTVADMRSSGIGISVGLQSSKSFVILGRRVGAIRPRQPASEDTMAWNKPKIVEITLGAEIGCYACAEL